MGHNETKKLKQELIAAITKSWKAGVLATKHINHREESNIPAFIEAFTEKFMVTWESYKEKVEAYMQLAGYSNYAQMFSQMTEEVLVIVKSHLEKWSREGKVVGERLVILDLLFKHKLARSRNKIF